MSFYRLYNVLRRHCDYVIGDLQHQARNMRNNPTCINAVRLCLRVVVLSTQAGIVFWVCCLAARALRLTCADCKIWSSVTIVLRIALKGLGMLFSFIFTSILSLFGWSGSGDGTLTAEISATARTIVYGYNAELDNYHPEVQREDDQDTMGNFGIGIHFDGFW